MRQALVLALLGALAVPAAAHPRGCGGDGYAWRARPYRAVLVAYRVSTRYGYDHFQRRLARYDYYSGGYGQGYGGYGWAYGNYSGGYGRGHGFGWRPRPCVDPCGFRVYRYFSSRYAYYGFSPYVRNAELLRRLGTVFTVEGAATGDGGADYDGLPRAPARLVGARFVE